ncbi:HK97 gp10 family phage protein [Clostridium sardiniense]|uniref:HK97 gp10 family phage protein n=1 Tax=Clostridium sardiniense TaxID=29369 RepID=UPI00195E00D1|nr:HK97 gp10 family phage protein [Clostridium sardiniense]MBM7836439.1 hypothetical protein [Clostridium sardiniense]
MIETENRLPEIIKQLQDASIQASREIEVTVKADIISVTPVKTGTLARSITSFRKPEGSNIRISWGSNLVYAAKVEFENKSYLRVSLERDKMKILNILIKHFRKVGK